MCVVRVQLINATAHCRVHQSYKMLLKQLSKCVTVYMVSVVLLATHLTQSEASVLRKTQRRDGRKEAAESDSGIRDGVIVFGKGPYNASLEDDASYQADFPEFPKGKVLDFKEALWKRMSPSLQCGSDQMKFRAVGSPVKNFSLDQHPPMPLSHVPSTCGYNMQRNPFGLVMNVPYHGCYVSQEGGNYNLPMLWNGIPVSLKCPKPQDGSTTAAPQVPVLPNPFMYPWPMPKPQGPTIAVPQDPALAQVPFQLLWNQLQKPNQPSTAAPPQNPALWNAYLPHLQQLLQDQSTTAAPSPQNPALWNAYLPHLQQLLQDQSTTAAPSPQNPALWNAYLPHLQQLLQDQSTTAAPSPQDPALWNTYLSYLQQLLQDQSTTAAPPPQDPALWNTYPSYLQQLLQDQSTTTAPPQDPTQWNAYLSYLQQLFYNKDQYTAAPQDPVQMPQQLSPFSLYQLLQQHYKPKDSTFPPYVPQNPLASPFGSVKYPWVYGLPTSAPASSDSSNLGSYAFNPYLYSLYTGKDPKGAPASTLPPSGYSWYGQNVNIPWWIQGKVPAAEPTTTASYKPPQYAQVPVWYMQHTTAAPTTNPGQMLFNPVEVSKLQKSK